MTIVPRVRNLLIGLMIGAAIGAPLAFAFDNGSSGDESAPEAASLARAAAPGAQAESERVSVLDRPQKEADMPDVSSGKIDRSTARLAVANPDGSKIYVAMSSDGGQYCLLYTNTLHATAIGCQPLSTASLASAPVTIALEPSIEDYLVIGLVPDGYTTVRSETASAAVNNNVYVFGLDDVGDRLSASGPAGEDSIDVADLVAAAKRGRASLHTPPPGE